MTKPELFWRHIAPLKSRGLTQKQIADALNAMQVPCERGGRWDQPKICRIINTFVEKRRGGEHIM